MRSSVQRRERQNEPPVDNVSLIRNGFYVGRYISLEAKIAKNKDLYYDVLGQAQIGWYEGKEDDVPFIKYLLGTILAAYKNFGDRFALVETKLSALEMVRRAAMNKSGRITKQDSRELCPSLSISSIEGALRKLVASGELKREGTGKKPAITEQYDSCTPFAPGAFFPHPLFSPA